jgi:hypothetical protein
MKHGVIHVTTLEEQSSLEQWSKLMMDGLLVNIFTSIEKTI